jgi:hypothetical protein
MSEILLKMDIGLHLKYHVFLSDFNETSTLSTCSRGKKNTHISNFMKIRSMRAELSNGDGWTDGRIDRPTDMLCHCAGYNIKMAVDEMSFNILLSVF